MSEWNRLSSVVRQDQPDLIARQQAQITMLREALIEVRLWISNWDPSFIHDAEWPATAAKIDEALKEDG